MPSGVAVRLVVLVVAVVASGARLQAQIVQGPTHVIFSDIKGGVSVAYDPDANRYLIVAGSEQLYGMFVDTAGTPLGARFTIPFGGGLTAFNRDVVYSPEIAGTGGFLVSYVSGGTIRGRVVAYPDQVGASEGVWGDGSSVPSLAYSGTSRQFLAAWTATVASGATEIRARPIGLDAQPVGGVVRVAGGRARTLAWNPATNEFAVAYSDEQRSASTHLARLTAGGRVIRDVMVGPTVRGAVLPTLAVNTVSGNYLAMWFTNYCQNDPRTGGICPSMSPYFAYTLAEIDSLGDTIASRNALWGLNDPIIVFDSGSRTFVVAGRNHFTSPDTSGRQLNERGEVIAGAAYFGMSTGQWNSTGSNGGAVIAAGPAGSWYMVDEGAPVRDYRATEMFGKVLTTTATSGGPADEPLADGCTGIDPYGGFGGGVCQYGQWISRSDPAASRSTGPASCSGADPFADAGGGLCVNGTWVTWSDPAARASTPEPAIDLLWHHQGDGRISSWKMTGTALRWGALLVPGQVPDTTWKAVATGDLDADGHADVVWQNIADGRVSAWFMDGLDLRSGALFSIPQVADLDWRIAAVGDFNADGRDDLVWQHRTSGSLLVWLLDGVTVLAETPLTPGAVADTNWQVVGAADFDRSGAPDLLWQHVGDGRLAVWAMSGTTRLRGDLLWPTRVPDGDLGWTLRGARDMNGDGRPDLIWQHAADGRIATWLMHGLEMISGTLLWPTAVEETNWRIVGAR